MLVVNELVFVTAQVHHQNFFDHFFFALLVPKTQWRLQREEEVDELGLVQLDSLSVFSELDPHLLEVCFFVIPLVDNVASVDIEVIEELDDDHNEHVQHYE